MRPALLLDDSDGAEVGPFLPISWGSSHRGLSLLSLPAVDLMQSGTTVILRNAKIDMFKGSMRLAVDKWGRVEVTEPATFAVKEENNLSLIEYELVNVVEE